MPSDTTPAAAIPGIGRDDPHFFEPWQAKAFALTVHLHDRGYFSWEDWVEVFSARIHGAPRMPDAASSAEHAEGYYLAWLGALEQMLTDRDIAGAETLREMAETWRRAALATPHGTPILYEAGLRG